MFSLPRPLFSRRAAHFYHRPAPCTPAVRVHIHALDAMSSAEPAVPEEWYCPITRELMSDPVIGPDGITYERAAITTWLESHTTSPITRQAMTTSTLTPNLALRHTIAAFKSANPGYVAQPRPALPDGAAPLFTPAPLSLKAETFTVASKTYLSLELTPPTVARRQPIAFIAILDNSGSMGQLASGAEGTEGLGFTRLDLVKHATRTIAAMMEPHDLLALVTFSTEARVVMPPTLMTAANKRRMSDAIDSIEPDSSTNIYDGIRQAAALANAPDMAGRHIVAMMMTDGYPNMDPPRGIVPTLRSMVMTNPWTVHAFGFGYDLDSALLESIAQWGNGLFGFIPDCSMVGTVFINFLAHMLSVVVPNAEVKYQGTNVAETTLHLGPVIAGQPRTHIVELPTHAGDIRVRYGDTTCAADARADVPVVPLAHADYMQLVKQLLARGSLPEAAESLLQAFVDKYSSHTEPEIVAFLRDVRSADPNEGQIGMAPKYFSRWGEHYMRAYLRAQQMQQCMNFKDPGLQIYGGDEFHAIQTAADTLFCTLPPPKPSVQPATSLASSRAAGGAGGSRVAPPLVSMSVFHNASGGCFHGDNRMRMADDTYKKVRDVKVGDLVYTPDGPAAVVFTVECRTRTRSQPMTQIGELSITPWHPVLLEGAWRFPTDVAGFTSRLVSVVHNFVLSAHHVVEVGGVLCCTLAHGLTGPVIEHAYFGAGVLTDLRKRVAGAATGHVVYENLKTVRHPETDAITGWVDAL